MRRSRRTASAVALAGLLVFGSRGVAAVLFSQNFEGLALMPFVSPTETGGDGTDWTAGLPVGWVKDNLTTPVGPPVEFRGFTFLDIDSWISTEGNQGRSFFTRGGVGTHSTIMVADPDAYDDGTDIDPNLFTAYIQTPAISLSGVLASSVQVKFDSSFRPSVDQTARLNVSFDGGSTFLNLLTFTTANSGGNDSTNRINEAISINVNNPAGGTMLLRFELANAGNDWWWAIDNLTVTGSYIKITSIKNNVSDVSVSWIGGNPPYSVEKCATLTSGVWFEVLRTNTMSANVPKDSAFGFIRVVGQP